MNKQKFYIQRIGKAVAYKELSRQAQKMVSEIKSFVKKTYKEVFNEDDNLPDDFEVVVSDVSKGKIGSYNYMTHVLTISPDAFEKDLVRWVILHEMAHAAIGNTDDSDGHGEDFRELATALGIPEKYQD